MKTAEPREPAADYEQQILRHVSRSFALTIPQLPAALRGVVTNAYLLCRIVDTIEDDESLPLDRKEFFFEEFIRVLQGQGSAREFAGGLVPLLSGRTLPEEKELIGNTPLILRTTMSLGEKQQAAIKRCAEIMARGMMGFQKMKSLQGLKDSAEFHLYCYHVAGVVGEMLTELFCEYSKEIACHRERLMAAAVSFGQGLQMTNIIKDLWEDREHGACWLPREVFQKIGCDLNSLSPGRYEPSFGKGLSILIGTARGHLENALAYTLMIPPGEAGIRKFCLWAIGMAVLTLRKIYRNPQYRSGQEVKISRRAVKSIIAVTSACLGNDLLLKTLFFLTTRSLPPVQSAPPGGSTRIYEKPI